MKIRVHGIFVSLFLAALFIFNIQLGIVHAQTTAFSYQGQLTGNDIPVTGTYNLTFSLFNVASGGIAVAGPVVTNGIAVNNGLFYVTLDFGAGVWSGQTNWLQIGVETNGATSFTTLVPRQEVLPAPYAIFASSASNLLGAVPAAQLSGALSLAQLPAGVVTNDETASVTLDNLTLNGTLNLSGLPVTINSGGGSLVRTDNNGNFFSGPYAGYLTTNGIDNTGNGFGALESNTNGSLNTANGIFASRSNKSGSANTANGSFALSENVSGNGNTADGFEALFNLGLGGVGGTNNIAIGYYAGYAFTGNESSNIDIGNNGVAGENGVIRIGTPGSQTVAYIAGQIIGDGSGLTNISSSQFGPISLAQLPAAVLTNNDSSSVTLDNLTLNGVLNLPAAPVTINSGGSLLLHADTNDNFFAGPDAGNLTTSGVGNTASGFQALQSNTSGVYNTASGYQALAANMNSYDNTADGAYALSLNTSGGNNTAIGSVALYHNTTAFANTAIGAGALAINSTGYANTASGEFALYYNTTGFNNTADGASALNNSTAGSNDVAIGYNAGSAFTGNESYNVDIGNVGVQGESGIIRIGTPGIQTAAYIAGSLTVYGALNLPALPMTINSGTNLLQYADTNFNFFSGPNAGNLATSGKGNTAVGSAALQNNTSGASNTADGNAALQNNTSGNFNMADGAGALYFNRSGGFNTAVGWGAMQNIGLGNAAGGTNNIALGYNAGGALTGNESSNIDIGNVGVAGESRIIRIGTPGVQTATYLSGTVYANGVALSSDRNAKEHFSTVNTRTVLDKVVALPVSEWNYKSDKGAQHIGPMAQDFHAAFGLDGTDDRHISVVDEGGVAMAAIQGLNQKLEAENTQLRKRLDELEAQVKLLAEKKQ